jgi:hypothetical protein
VGGAAQEIVVAVNQKASNPGAPFGIDLLVYACG